MGQVTWIILNFCLNGYQHQFFEQEGREQILQVKEAFMFANLYIIRR